MSTAELLISEYATPTPSLESPRLPQRPGPIRMKLRWAGGVQLTHRPGHGRQLGGCLELAIRLWIHVDDVRDVRHQTVRDETVNAEHHIGFGHPSRNDRRRPILRERLSSALSRYKSEPSEANSRSTGAPSFSCSTSRMRFIWLVVKFVSCISPSNVATSLILGNVPTKSGDTLFSEPWWSLEKTFSSAGYENPGSLRRAANSTVTKES